MSAIEEIGAAVASVASAVATSVVGIGRDNRGAGVVTADGQVLTNAHNLRGGEVTVTFADGRSTIGTVAAVDPDGDLAVVQGRYGRRQGDRVERRQRREGRGCRVRRRRDARRRRAGHVRPRVVDRAIVPRTRWAADRR